MSNKHLKKIDIDHETYSRPKLSKMKIIVLTAVLGIIAVVAGAGLKFYTAFHAKPDDINKEIEKTLAVDSPEYNALKKQGRFNMMILGEDNVEGSRRSDTILFAEVDLNDKNIRVLAIPRDTRVDIPGHGTHKINSAYAFGGPELLKTTIQNYLNVPILYYVVVDYDNFPKLVDALGGVDINVKKRMRYVDHAGKLNINIQPGFQHMNGVTALHFVRFRKDAAGDIGRVERQQQFTKALIKKAYDPRMIVRMPETVGQIIQVFKTDMPATLAVKLAGFIKNELTREDIFFSTLRGKPEMISRLSYWIGDVSAAKTYLDSPIEMLKSGDVSLDKKVGGKYAGFSLGYSSAADDNPLSKDKKETQTQSDSKPQENKKFTKTELLNTIRSMSAPIAVLNGSGEAGVGQTVAQKLQTIGIDVVYTGNAKHFDYQYSNVIYPIKTTPQISDTARKIGQLVSVPKALVRPNKQAFYASLIVGHDYIDLNKKIDALVAASKK